jgi:spore germination protein YaaH
VQSAVAAGCEVIAIPHVVDVPPRRGVRIIDSLAGLDVDELMPASPRARSRRGLLLGATAVVLASAGGVAAVTRSTHQPPPAPLIDIPIDAWAPYWALTDAQASVETYGPLLRQVSPFWYSAIDATTVTVSTNLSSDVLAAFVEAARSRGALILPSISDALPAGGMAGVLSDATTRSAHVDTIVNLVSANDFDGIDLDYEQFAFADDKATWSTTRPVWLDFLAQLSDRLHAAGKLLTVSVPYITDTARTDLSGYWVYDYAGMEPHVDAIRIMAYDYSTAAAGPIAPIPFVQQAVSAAKKAVDDDGKLVLGIPLYGYNWPVATVGTCPPNAEGKTSVTQRTIDELLAKRGATPIHDPATGEASFTYLLDVTDGTSTCTQTRQVHYVDAAGARERIDLARRERIGAVSLWALGFDSAATWVDIGQLARVPGASTTTVGP